MATPIAILFSSYASMRDDALSQNLFTVSNEQIFDVVGRSQNPYKTNTLLAAASIKKEFTNTVTFTYNPLLYYTNTTTTISAFWVDFKDGQGYKTIPLNSSVSKTYTDSSSTKLIDFKAQLSTGDFVYCHNSVDVFVTSTYAQRYAGGDPNGRHPTFYGCSLRIYANDVLCSSRASVCLATSPTSSRFICDFCS